MELDRLEKRIRALQARKAARAATFERVQGIDPTEHEAAVYHAIHADIAADAHTYYNLPGGRGSCKSSFVSLEIVDGIQKDPTGTGSAVVFRRWGSTLRESVFAQIQWAIDALGVSTCGPAPCPLCAAPTFLPAHRSSSEGWTITARSSPSSPQRASFGGYGSRNFPSCPVKILYAL